MDSPNLESKHLSLDLKFDSKTVEHEVDPFSQSSTPPHFSLFFQQFSDPLNLIPIVLKEFSLHWEHIVKFVLDSKTSHKVSSRRLLSIVSLTSIHVLYSSTVIKYEKVEPKEKVILTDIVETLFLLQSKKSADFIQNKPPSLLIALLYLFRYFNPNCINICPKSKDITKSSIETVFEKIRSLGLSLETKYPSLKLKFTLTNIFVVFLDEKEFTWINSSLSSRRNTLVGKYPYSSSKYQQKYTNIAKTMLGFYQIHELNGTTLAPHDPTAGRIVCPKKQDLETIEYIKNLPAFKLQHGFSCQLVDENPNQFQFHIGSWNLKHEERIQTPDSRSMAARYLCESGCDIIFFQESSSKSSLNFLSDKRAKRSGEDTKFQVVHPHQAHSMSICFNPDLVQTLELFRFHDPPKFADEPLVAYISSGKSPRKQIHMVIVSVHLKAVSRNEKHIANNEENEKLQKHQLEFLLERLSLLQSAGVPILLLGDFNCLPLDLYALLHHFQLKDAKHVIPSQYQTNRAETPQHYDNIWYLNSKTGLYLVDWITHSKFSPQTDSSISDHIMVSAHFQFLLRAPSNKISDLLDLKITLPNGNKVAILEKYSPVRTIRDVYFLQGIHYDITEN